MPRGATLHYARPADGCQNESGLASQGPEGVQNRTCELTFDREGLKLRGREPTILFRIHQEDVEMVPSSEELADVTGEWECMECGYVQEGVEGRRPKKCPECDAPASALEFFSDDDDAVLNRVGENEYDDEVGEEYDEEEDEENGSAFHSRRS
jgi:hypothetical protein